MPTPTPEYVQFAVHDKSRFEALQRAFDAIKHDKDTDSFRDRKDWLEYFDDEALAHFWWPTRAERAAYWERWWSAPVETRFSDPSLRAPSWDFGAMFEAFQNGEYELVACRLISEEEGRFEFESFAFPYGGTACMHMLISAFGFHVTGEDDGTGYKPVAR